MTELNGTITLPKQLQTIYDKITDLFYSSLVKKYQSIIKSETDGGLLTLNTHNNDDFMSINSKNILVDYELSVSPEEFIKNVDRISVSFYYEFGSGHTNNNKIHVPEWHSPFKNYDAWEKEILEKLTTIDMNVAKRSEIQGKDFSYSSIDSDSDFGLQGFFLTISKSPID